MDATIPLDRIDRVQRAFFGTQAAASTDGAGVTTIEMRAVGYGSVNRYGRLFVPGAFAESIDTLKQELEEKPLPIGWMHELPIGKFTELQDQVDGPRLRGPISNTTAGQDAATLVRDGLTASSVGFTIENWVDDIQWGEPSETVTFDTPYGTFTYTFQDWVIYVKRAQLVECSLVLVGGDDDSRVVGVQSLMEKAQKALPAIATQGASWEDVAYSMALLMGGRGAAAFQELPELEHAQLYMKLAAGYARYGKTPPAYSRNPKYDDVAFQHGEREIFGDRYLRKNLRTVTAGAQGIAGPLSDETREEAQRAITALTGLTRRDEDPTGDGEQKLGLTVLEALRQTTATARGEQSNE
jgi:Caudovirus prohead serine protease